MSKEAVTDELDTMSHDDNCGANINEKERLISLAGGSLLALYGLSRRSWGGVGLALAGAALLHRGLTHHCKLYAALGIDTSGHDHDESVDEFKPSIPVKHGKVVEKSVIIDKPRAELYAFWRNFENLPRFMTHLEEVRVLDERRSHWVAKAPAGTTIAWDAAITDERENEVIAWHSSRDSVVHNTGSVRFHDAPDGQGTEVKVVLQYIPPGGAVGTAVAKMWGEEPVLQIDEDLRRFKQLMETGEVPTDESS